MKKLFVFSLLLMVTNCFLGFSGPDAAYYEEIRCKRMRDRQITRLHLLLRAELNWNDQMISDFTQKLLRSRELQTHGDFHGKLQELPTKIVIVTANIVDWERRRVNNWTYGLREYDRSFIESYLARNPDPDVRKISNHLGDWYAFDHPEFHKQDSLSQWVQKLSDLVKSNSHISPTIPENPQKSETILFENLPSSHSVDDQCAISRLAQKISKHFRPK